MQRNGAADPGQYLNRFIGYFGGPRRAAAVEQSRP